jgi:hypothetical protein
VRLYTTPTQKTHYLGFSNDEIAIVSDRFINGQPAPGFMAQVYLGGRPFSAPLTIGEAGFYLDDVGYYTYRD